MSLNNKCFSVFLYDSERDIIPAIDGVFFLDDGTEYQIAVFNHSRSQRANVTIFIDGKRIGYFRIPLNDKIVIERSSDKDRKLTFHDVQSGEGIMGGLRLGNMDLGKIRLEFELEKIETNKHLEIARSAKYGRHDAGGYDEIDGCSGSDESDGGVDCTDGMCDGPSPLRRQNAFYGGTVLGRQSTQKFTSSKLMSTNDEIVVIEGRMLLKQYKFQRIREAPILPL